MAIQQVSRSYLQEFRQQQMLRNENNDHNTLELIKALGGIDNLLDRLSDSVSLPQTDSVSLPQSDTKQIKSNKINTNSDKYNQNENTDKSVVMLDKNNTYLDSCFGQSTTKKILYIIHHQITRSLVIVLIIICIVWSLITVNLWYCIYTILYSIYVIIYGSFYALSINKNAFRKIIKTMDFWILPYYSIAAIVCVTWYTFETNVAAETKNIYVAAMILFTVAFIIIVLIITSFDGYPGIRKHKIFFSGFIGIICIFISTFYQFISYSNGDDSVVYIYNDIGFSRFATISNGYQIIGIFMFKQCIFTYFLKAQAAVMVTRPFVIWTNGKSKVAKLSEHLSTSNAMHNIDNNEHNTLKTIKELGGIDNLLDRLLKEKSIHIAQNELNDIHKIIKNQPQSVSNPLQQSIDPKIKADLNMDHQNENSEKCVLMLDKNNTYLASFFGQTRANKILNIIHHKITRSLFVILLITWMIWNFNRTRSNVWFYAYMLFFSTYTIIYGSLHALYINKNAFGKIVKTGDFWIQVYYLIVTQVYSLWWELDTKIPKDSTNIVIIFIVQRVLFSLFVLIIGVVVVSFDGYSGIKKYKILISGFLGVVFMFFSILRQFTSYASGDDSIVYIYNDIGFSRTAQEINGYQIIGIFMFKQSIFTYYFKKQAAVMVTRPFLIWENLRHNLTQISKTTSKNAMYNVETNIKNETNNITEINLQKVKTMSEEECKKEINEHDDDFDETNYTDSDDNEQNKNDNCKQDIQIINITYYNNNE